MGERAVRWSAAMGCAVAVALLMVETWTDWAVYHLGATTLLSDRAIHLYAAHPGIQVGPLGLLVGLLPQGGAQIFGLVLMLPALWLLERLALTSRHLLAAEIAVGLVWPVTAMHVQTADLLVLLAVLTAALLIREQRWEAGLLIGGAILVKPWALPLAVMLLALPTRTRGRALVASMLGLVGFLPFLLDTGTWTAGEPQLGVNLGSLLHPFTHVAPGWLRPVQLLLCSVLALWAVRRDWMAVLLLVPAARLLLDASSYPYQAVPVVVAAVAYELGTGRSLRLTWLALGLVLASSPFLAVNDNGAAVVLRGMLLLLILGLCLAGLRQRRHVERPHLDVAPLRAHVA